MKGWQALGTAYAAKKPNVVAKLLSLPVWVTSMNDLFRSSVFDFQQSTIHKFAPFKIIKRHYRRSAVYYPRGATYIGTRLVVSFSCDGPGPLVEAALNILWFKTWTG